MMKIIATIVILLLASGCTTFKPVGLESEKLHEQLYAGEIIHVEDKVKILTSDGIDHRFEVLEIKENRIMGSEVSIPFENIVAIEKRQFSAVKTTVLVVGIIVAASYVLAVAVENSGIPAQ